MISVFNDIKGFLRVSPVTIDNLVFKLHYKASVVILLIFSILVNSRQFFGDPIDCTQPVAELTNIIDTYCWFNSYNLVSEDGQVVIEAKKFLENINNKRFHRVKQTFYQWVGIILLLQAGFFYFPRYLWRYVWEEGRVKELVQGMNSHAQSEEDIHTKGVNIVEYMKRNRGQHRLYFAKFFLCEFLNLVNVIFQVFLTDWLLGNSFRNYGYEWVKHVMKYSADEPDYTTYHPFHRYFPKLAACDVHYGNAAFQTNTVTALCVLPIHIFNEKIYLFLWFYFWLLAVITAVSVAYRIGLTFSPQLRQNQLSKMARVSKVTVLRNICKFYDMGDWFIVYQIGKNMNSFTFGKVLESLNETCWEKYDRNRKAYSDDVTLPLGNNHIVI